MRLREILNTSVRTLHSAIMAGSATEEESDGRGGPCQEGRQAQSPRLGGKGSGHPWDGWLSC